MISEEINDIKSKLMYIEEKVSYIDEVKYIKEKIISLEEKINMIIAQQEIYQIEKEQLMNSIFLLQEKTL
jgi:hypothetical protein